MKDGKSSLEAGGLRGWADGFAARQDPLAGETERCAFELRRILKMLRRNGCDGLG